MERSIVGFHLDDESDWVAELECGHGQHVRHRPPFQLRPWVLDEETRAARIGSPLDCPLCERAEMPDGLRFARRSAEWDEVSLPPGLRRAHRLAAGTWGRLVVRTGSVVFRARTSPPIDQVLVAGTRQPIPPTVEHEIELAAGARLSIEFFQVMPFNSRRPEQDVSASPVSDEGGDPACWAHLFCIECGSMLREGHREGCPLNPPG